MAEEILKPTKKARSKAEYKLPKGYRLGDDGKSVICEDGFYVTPKETQSFYALHDVVQNFISQMWEDPEVKNDKDIYFDLITLISRFMDISIERNGSYFVDPKQKVKIYAYGKFGQFLLRFLQSWGSLETHSAKFIRKYIEFTETV